MSMVTLKNEQLRKKMGVAIWLHPVFIIYTFLNKLGLIKGNRSG